MLRQPSIVLQCKHCGQNIQTWPSQRRKYCSKTCKDTAHSLKATNTFLDKFDRSGGSDACHPWMRGRDWDGYGVGTYQGRQVRTHRTAWEIANGRTVPDGLGVLHTCDNPPCGNPQHLFLGTAKDNNRDRAAKGRTWDQTGDNHWTHRSPERVRRGERHWTHLPQHANRKR